MTVASDKFTQLRAVLAAPDGLKPGMRTSLTALIFAAAASAECLFYPQPALPRTEPNSLQLETKTPQPPFVAAAHQKDCIEAARARSHRDGWDGDTDTALIAHYNERLKRCFVEFVYVGRDAEGRSVINRSLSDAHGREYADLVSVGESSHGPFREPPLLCEFVLSSGEQMECNSSDDFNTVIDNYMN